MPATVIDLLQRRRREAGGTPLITYYDLGSGERTELSAITFGTWVDKTSNLLVDELMIDPGDPVELDLALTNPAHWVTLIWELACWQVGSPVTLGLADAATVLVVGPEADRASRSAEHLVVCSLHPLGLGLRPAPQPPVVDYNAEVRLQPDAYLGAAALAGGAAWIEVTADRRTRRLDAPELVTGRAAPPARRLLTADPTRPDAAWQAASSLLDALAAGGSLVVVVGGDDPARVDRISAQERVESVIGETPRA